MSSSGCTREESPVARSVSKGSTSSVSFQHSSSSSLTPVRDAGCSGGECIECVPVCDARCVRVVTRTTQSGGGPVGGGGGIVSTGVDGVGEEFRNRSGSSEKGISSLIVFGGAVFVTNRERASGTTSTRPGHYEVVEPNSETRKRHRVSGPENSDRFINHRSAS